MFRQRQQGVAPARLPRPARAATPFADPLDQCARSRCWSTPPPEVLAAVDEAARVWRLLDRRGLRVHFDVPGGVSAALCRHSGRVVRPLSLREATDPSALLRHAAG